MRLAHTVALGRTKTTLFLLLLALFAGSQGCVTSTGAVTERLAIKGYAIWYPAESGIEPGQIWLYDGTLRAKFADCPAKLGISTPRPASIAIEGIDDAAGTLETTFTQATISKAGPFAAELDAGTVKGGTFRLGPITSVSIDLGNPLLNDANKKYGSGYAKALQMVRDDTPGLVLIAAVVQVPRIEYTFYCEDPFKLVERLPRIRDMLHARVDAVVINTREIHVTMTPIEGMLTLGVTPVRGERLLLTTEEAQKALGHDLLLAQKQSYALRPPVPAIVVPPEQAHISNYDPAAQVVVKYREAIGDITLPTTLPATLPGGGSSWRTPEPRTRPSR